MTPGTYSWGFSAPLEKQELVTVIPRDYQTLLADDDMKSEDLRETTVLKCESELEAELAKTAFARERSEGECRRASVNSMLIDSARI